jgi:large subunit ribosomal protein L17
MRHNVKTKKFSRDVDHRKALVKNLAGQLILEEKVETTLAKAKYIKPYVEKLITRAKKTSEDKLAKFNTIKYLRTKVFSEKVIKKLVSELGTRYKSREGGYTRIVKTGNRAGDNAFMGRIELVKETPNKKGAKK